MKLSQCTASLLHEPVLLAEVLKPLMTPFLYNVADTEVGRGIELSPCSECSLSVGDHENLLLAIDLSMASPLLVGLSIEFGFADE